MASSACTHARQHVLERAGVRTQRTGYGALVALDERLSRYELVKDRRGERARAAHRGDGHLLLESEWHGHGVMIDVM